MSQIKISPFGRNDTLPFKGRVGVGIGTVLSPFTLTEPTPILTFPLKGKGLSSSPFKGEARRGMGQGSVIHLRNILM